MHILFVIMSINITVLHRITLRVDDVTKKLVGLYSVVLTLMLALGSYCIYANYELIGWGLIFLSLSIHITAQQWWGKSISEYKFRTIATSTYVIGQILLSIVGGNFRSIIYMIIAYVTLILTSLVMYKTSVSLHDFKKNPNEIYFKTAGTLLLAVIAGIVIPTTSGIMPSIILVGLVISSMGDLSLAISYHKESMSAKSDVDYSTIGTLLFIFAYLTYSIGIFTYIYKLYNNFKCNKITISVLIYMIQLTLLPISGLMFVLSDARPISIVLFIGTIFIYISDAIIAYSQFNRHPIFFKHSHVMLTYVIGQALLTTTVFFVI